MHALQRSSKILYMIIRLEKFSHVEHEPRAGSQTEV